MSVQDIFDAVLNFNIETISNLVKVELDAGTNTKSILNDGLIAAMDEVGRRFSAGEFYIPEMLVAAKVMQMGMDVLKRDIVKTDIRAYGTVVIGTVRGDLHDIGKNLVVLMLEGSGFDVIDLGINVDTIEFLKAVKEHDVKIVGLSALLTATMQEMEKTIASLKKEQPDVKVMVGGAPLSQAFADSIKADGYGKDAPSAVRLVRKFLKLSRSHDQNKEKD